MGPLVENPEFVRFAHHWQFRARACRPYRAKTKGKVERPIRYVRDNFVYGREFLNDEDLDAQLERWLREVANVRHHRTIQQRPLERFEHEERGALGPLAQRPYRSLVLPTPMPPRQRRKTKGLVTPPTFEVERRPASAVRPYRRGWPMKAVSASRREQVRAMLADLKMPGALEAVDSVLSDADGGGVTTAEAIERLLGAQITLRNNRRLQAAMRSSRLPVVKTLDEFDFSFQPSIKREQIENLHELGFVERKENVVLLGPPGVGKTHLAISLAIAAAQNGRRVYYGTLAELITSFEEAHAGILINGVRRHRQAS